MNFLDTKLTFRNFKIDSGGVTLVLNLASLLRWDSSPGLAEVQVALGFLVPIFEPGICRRWPCRHAQPPRSEGK